MSLATARDTAGFLAEIGSASGKVVAELVRTKAGQRKPARGTATLTDYTPMLPASVADPYPFYRELLATGPVHYNPREDIWILSRFDDVRAALRAHDVLSSADGLNRQRAQSEMLIALDRPKHTRMRGLIAGDFTRGALDRWQPAVNDLADALVADMVRRGSGGTAVEALAALAERLPIQLIARMLGVPVADQARFRLWSHRVVRAGELDLKPRSLLAFGGAVVAMVRLRRYLYQQIVLRRQRPSDDLLGRLVGSTGRSELSDDDMFYFAFLLLLAGSETTTNLLSGLLLTLARRPELVERLRADPTLIPSAIAEQLRVYSPVQCLYRSALSDYPVGEHTIPAGARVLLLFAAANRDPRHYPDPDVYRLDRNPSDHLAFGSGIHFCIGAYLSRIETERVVQQLVRSVSRIEVAGPVTWTRNPMFRGITSLPLRFTSHPSRSPGRCRAG